MMTWRHGGIMHGDWLGLVSERWHGMHADVDSPHVERIGESGVLKNVGFGYMLNSWLIECLLKVVYFFAKHNNKY